MWSVMIMFEAPSAYPFLYDEIDLFGLVAQLVRAHA